MTELSKIHCPNFHEFWVERDRENGIHEPQDNEGFQRAQRQTTRGERRAHPGAVILIKDGVETLVPGVDFSPLKDIEYRILVRGVLEANPTRSITLPEMQLIWDAIIYKVYRFECGCAKESKIIEVNHIDVQSRNNALMTDTRQSMGLDGFNQTEYDQLVSDVRNGLPPARPKLLVTLRVPCNKRLRETRVSESDSEVDEDGFRAEEVLERSGIGDERMLIRAKRATH